MTDPEKKFAIKLGNGYYLRMDAAGKPRCVPDIYDAKHFAQWDALRECGRTHLFANAAIVPVPPKKEDPPK